MSCLVTCASRTTLTRARPRQASHTHHSPSATATPRAHPEPVVRPVRRARAAAWRRMSTYTVDEDFTGADRIVSALGEPGDVEVVSLADLKALLPQPA
eukprot:7295265-Prymnesium_polylepis.1